MTEITRVGVVGAGIMGDGIWLGTKSGLGFYDDSGAAPVENPGAAR